MRPYHLLPALLLVCHSAMAEPMASCGVIPLPAHWEPGTGGMWKPGQAITVHTMDGHELAAALTAASGVTSTSVPATAAADVVIGGIDGIPANQQPPGGEGYVLTIDAKGARIQAATPAGRFYGFQSLLQLCEQAKSGSVGAGTFSIPSQRISDSPRFAWRGYMLDESRHFSGVEAVKRLLDGMARYKLNRLHWHLTDSPGWRIEIKAYPKLTEVGSRGSESDRRPDAPRQFYTQEEIRELVAYAKARHITILPEIDMPGHADAAVSAYPDHDGGGFTRPPGKGTSWPRFTFNPAREETLKFLDTILAETAALFPDAGVIHFGGDEVHFGWQKWPELDEVKSLMKKEGCTKLDDVEAWFNRRMAGTINKLGFKTGGWDEITARNLPADKTVVFWWRHDKPDILHKALAAGYPVVLCPRRPLYFDFVQHDSHKAGRRWGGFNPLADVYAFPAALGLTPEQEKSVLGIQACLWTETTATQKRRDFLTWPRLIAMAEAAWTPATRKDFAGFESRLNAQFAWLDAHGLGYYNPFTPSAEVLDPATGKPAGHLD